MKINYEPILRRSFEISKTYRWLLVYGMVLAGIGGGGSGFNGISFSGSDTQNMDPTDLNDLPAKTANVLGEHTNYFANWISSIDPALWVFLIMTIISLVILGITISLLLTNWAKASLIQGIDMALSDERSITLKNTSTKGMRYVKNLIILSFINLGFVLLFVILIPAIGFLVYFLVKNFTILKILWIVLASIIGSISFVLGVITIAMIGVYAERLIILHDHSPFDAWKKGLSLSRGNFLWTLLMGFLNMVISTLIGCLSVILALLILGVPILVMLLPYIRSGTFPGVHVFIVGAIFLIVFIVFNMVIRAGISVFKYSNWNQFFNIVLEHTKEVPEDE